MGKKLVAVVVLTFVAGAFVPPLTQAQPGPCSAQCIEQAKAKKRAAVRRAHRRKWERVSRPYRPHLFQIGRCESGGHGPRPIWHDPGMPWGGLGLIAWADYGGKGMPYQASIMEQYYRAALIVMDVGWGAWECKGP